MRIELESIMHEMNALIANLTRLRVYAQHNANIAKSGNNDAYTKGFYDGKTEGLRLATRRAIEVMERIEPANREGMNDD